MTTAWMLYLLLIGTLLACGALAVDGGLRRTSLSTRWVWGCAMAGIVILALAKPRAQGTQGTVDAPLATTAPRADKPTSQIQLVAVLASARLLVSGSVARVMVGMTSRLPGALSVPLAAVWAALSLAILALLALVNRRVDRARHEWPTATMFGTRVRVSPMIGPAVIGLSRPEIVVPRWLLERTDDEQRLVVVHEREHVAAHDQLLLTGAWLVVALLPWHPAVWWMLSRVRLAIELDCDARVLRRGVEPRSYGTLLIELAGKCAGLRIGVLALADRTTHLERRLLAMKPPHSRFTLVRTSILGSIAALLVLVACESRLPTSAEISTVDAATMEKRAAEAHLRKPAAAHVYIVDGKAVSDKEAHAILAGAIASVEVSTAHGNEPAQILITTKAAASADNSQDKFHDERVAFKKRSETLTDSAGYVTNTVRGPDGRVRSVRVKADTANAATVRRREGGASTDRSHMKTFTGVLFIDGVRSTQAQLAPPSPGDMLSVEVVKGPIRLVRKSL
jgi:beta-lactamase regulating signal transducer with metallopeptidase domain